MPLLTLLELTCGLGRAVVCACQGGPLGRGCVAPQGLGPGSGVRLCLQMSLRKGMEERGEGSGA